MTKVSGFNVTQGTALLSHAQQAAISQKEIVFRFRKDVQSEKGWGLKCCA